MHIDAANMKFEIRIFVLLLNTVNIFGQNNSHYRDQFKTICGQAQTTARIIGGTDAELGEFPWIARIGLRYQPPIQAKRIFFCGGALITNRHVLSAGHCFFKYYEYTEMLVISLGDFHSKHRSICKGNLCSDPSKYYKVEAIFPYHLNVNNTKNDIAVIKLAETVKFTHWISPICLPDNITITNLIGQDAIAAGFGFVNSYLEKEAEVLQKVMIPILNLTVCEVFKDPPEIGQICAGTIGKDTCDGDSGGPLFKLFAANGGPRYVLLGVISFGASECEDDHPAVYTDVNYYMPWIDTQLNK